MASSPKWQLRMDSADWECVMDLYKNVVTNHKPTKVIVRVGETIS